MDYRAGVAEILITHAEPVWAAGYAFRIGPVSRVESEPKAKALALEDGSGTRIVVVTTDLLGLPLEVAYHIKERIARRLHLPRSAILLTSSRTHCGPVLANSLVDMYAMSTGDQARSLGYTSGSWIGSSRPQFMPSMA
jgi:hypothetical protein